MRASAGLSAVWASAALGLIAAATLDVVDLGVTLPGNQDTNSTIFGSPVFPVIPRTFSSNASNFAIDWNIATQWTTRDALIYDRSNRPFALVHLAQYQALRVNEGLTTPVEPNALAAYAAHGVLCALFPATKGRYDELLRQQLQAISPALWAPARQVAVAVIANLLLHRSDDGSQQTIMSLPPGEGHIPGTSIGQFTPVSGNYQGSNYQYANATPFLLPTPVTQLSVLKDDPGPPDLTSKFYDTNYKAVVLLGAANSTFRTRYQTDQAYFWFQGAGTCGYHGQWNQIALTLLPSDATLSDTVNLLAHIAVSTYDTFIVVYSSKVRWQRWRPVTAIHAGDCFPGGPDYCHQPIPDWQPLLPTPNNPAYPSFIGAAAGAAEGILNSFFNITRAFTIGSEAFTPTGRLEPRLFTGPTQAALDCCNSRGSGGAELIPDALAGRGMGLEVSQYVLDGFSMLDPLSPDVSPAYASLLEDVQTQQDVSPAAGR